MEGKALCIIRKKACQIVPWWRIVQTRGNEMSVFELNSARNEESFADKAECLKTMVGWLEEANALESRSAFLRDINSREEVMPTGIGRGIAMPHARSTAAKRLAAAVCVLRQPLDWQALDGKPVRIIILVAVPPESGKEYMQLMQHISEFCRHEENRNALLMAQGSDAILELLRKLETDKG